MTGGQEHAALELFEVAGVLDVADGRHERRRHLAAEHRAPVDRPHPAVLLDVPHAVGHVPVPPGHVHPEQAAQQIHQVAGKAVRAVIPTPRDVPVQDLVVAVYERRAAGQHLVQEDSERPIVHRLAISWQKQFYATGAVKRGLPNP